MAALGRRRDEKATEWAGSFWRRITGMVALASALVIALAPGGGAFAFGGEDLIQGNPWHHEDLTCRALAGDKACLGVSDIKVVYPGTGFDHRAARSIAWHADYLDSYLYSPLWWASAGVRENGTGPARPINILDRYKASRSNYWHLASLHFDDLNSTQDIEDAWRRYAAGTLIALEWAAEQDDVDAAHNVLGLSLHAMQDFYSHSTWINVADRRKYTYLQTPKANRQRMALMTGAYERALGPIQHGKYNFACSVYGGDLDSMQKALAMLCSSALPTANLEFCEKARECEQSRQDTATVEVFGGETRVAVLAPPGIAMDTTWLARIGGDMRGLTENKGQKITDTPTQGASPNLASGVRDRIRSDMGRVQSDVRNAMVRDVAKDLANLPSRNQILPAGNGLDDIKPRDVCREIINRGNDCEQESDFLFAETKHLAAVTSHQWMTIVDNYMTANKPDFWQKVKTCRDSVGRAACRAGFSSQFPPSTMTAAFEDYSKFPFQFLTAGANSPAPLAKLDGWYLRVLIKTDWEQGSGTDADIYLEADGKQFLLDYLNTRDTASKIRASALVYNDFEAGDHQVYTVGPFSVLPDTVTLFNDSASRTEVRRAFREAMKKRMRDRWNSFRTFFKNEQDYVGLLDLTLTRDQLDIALTSGLDLRQEERQEAFRPGQVISRVNGGAEGVYDIQFVVTKTPWRGTGAKRNWNQYMIRIDQITCIEESEIDGGSSADEPYFFFALASYGQSDAQTARFGPYDNIGVNGDDQRRIDIAHDFSPIELPRDGIITLGGQVWEHDNERASARTDLFERFTSATEPGDEEDYNIFLDEWGRTLGGDWKVNRLTIHAFRRSAQPAYGIVYDRVHNSWIEEEGRQSFTLDRNAGLRDLPVNLSNISTQTAAPTVRFLPPVILLPTTEK